MERKIKLLLLTNRDSDNVGDQFIEANDIALIKAAFKNLGIEESDLEITSKDASIISREYVETGNPDLIQNARALIEDTDIVFFGGAPLFNYLYQIFYERTAKTLEIAREFGKPVIFSSIGVEGYDEDNPRCQRLKETLNFDNVKLITTRDGFDLLEKYKENPALVIDKVADPAVFTKWTFRKYLGADKEERQNKKIGVFIIRANAFTDNKLDFNKDQAAQLWKDVASLLEEKGYDYELLTSGHFGDEAFMDKLIRERYVSADNCVFNINCPEDLISRYADFDGVISCRLHPAILSFSAEVPSVGLVWNPKVRGFYESIGYPDRVIEAEDITAENVVAALEKAMDEGVRQDPEYLMSVYRTIYSSLRDALDVQDPPCDMYTFEELTENLPDYPGTAPDELQNKLRRKFRRTYRKYNENNIKLDNVRAEKRAVSSELKATKAELKDVRTQLNKTFMRRVKRKIKKILN